MEQYWGGLSWMDKTLIEGRGHAGCHSYLTQLGKQISLLCLWFKINLSTLQIKGTFLRFFFQHCLSSVFSISTLSQNRNPISLLSHAISQDAMLRTSCRQMSAYVSAIFHTSTTTWNQVFQQQQYRLPSHCIGHIKQTLKVWTHHFDARSFTWQWLRAENVSVGLNWGKPAQLRDFAVFRWFPPAGCLLTINPYLDSVHPPSL